MGLYSITIVAASALMIALNIVFVTVLQLGFYALICGLACANFFQFVFFALLSKSRPRLKGFDPAAAQRHVALCLAHDAYRSCLLDPPIVKHLHTLGFFLVNRSWRLRHCHSLRQCCQHDRQCFFYLVHCLCVPAGERRPRSPEEIQHDHEHIRLPVRDGLYRRIAVRPRNHPPYDHSRLCGRQLPACCPVCCLGNCFYNVYRIAGYGVSFSKQSKYLAFPIFAAAGCALAGYLLLIPRLGGIGASVSLCVAYAVMAIMVFRFAQRLYPCPYETKKLLVGCSFLPRKLVRARFPVTAHPGRGMPRLHRCACRAFQDLARPGKSHAGRHREIAGSHPDETGSDVGQTRRNAGCPAPFAQCSRLRVPLSTYESANAPWRQRP